MRLGLALALWATAAAAVPTEPLVVNGKWQIEYNIFAKEGEFQCQFQHTGSELKGTCGKDSAATGRVDGDRVTWRVKMMFDGASAAMEFSGTAASPQKISGAVTLVDAGIDGEFTASKIS